MGKETPKFTEIYPSMAEVNNCPDPILPTKRISELTSHDSSIELKKQKLDTNPENNNNGKEEYPLTKNDVVLQEKTNEKQVEKEEKEGEEEEEHSNGEPVIDRKGKGILIEEDDEDDDDDDDDDTDSDDSAIGGNESSDDSDFVDDPLAEVNLDNILPSRTRRRTINPGAYLATDLPDEDSDDDPDAA